MKYKAKGQFLQGSAHSRVMQRKQPRVLTIPWPTLPTPPNPPQPPPPPARADSTEWAARLKLAWFQEGGGGSCMQISCEQRDWASLQLLAQLAYWPSGCSENKTWCWEVKLMKGHPGRTVKEVMLPLIPKCQLGKMVGGDNRREE